MKNLRKVLFLFSILLVPHACFGDAWKAYFGNLHSHTGASDGVDDAQVAYSWAHQQGQLDFLCLSEHNHIVTQPGLASDDTVAVSASTGDYVCLVGQEFSTLPPNGGNHINLHDVVDVVPAAMNNNYKELFHKWLPEYAQKHPDRVVVAQFNHPESVNSDYGITAIGGFQNYKGDWGAFIDDADPWVRLIAIISGPADSNMVKTKTPPTEAHRQVEPGMLSSWMNYLDKGFHLSPVADQDNHRHSWGTRTTARTGVWINGPFNKKSLLEALKAGRCFATEDKNLSVWLAVENQPMGARIADPGSKPLNIQITLSDADEPASSYVVELFQDLVGDGKKPKALLKNIVLKAGQTWTTNVAHKAGQHELFFAHVTQTTGTIKDEAWTAPVWIDPALMQEEPSHLATSVLSAQGRYAGSKNSKVVHFTECRELDKIATKNLVFSEIIPDGKHLHVNCPKE